MARTRWVLNGLSLAIILGTTPQVLGADEVGEGGDGEITGGTCCDRSGSTCYMNLDGILIKQGSAYYCKPSEA